MALIKCPECGREVSSKAVSCPHCGCPVDEKSKMEILVDEIYNRNPNNKSRAIKEFQKQTGMGLKNAKDIFDLKYQGRDISNAIKLSTQRQEEYEQNKEKQKQLNAQMRDNLNTLANLTTKDKTARCPKCGSTSITYIQKKGGFFGVEIMDGVFAGGSSSKGRLKCLNCGKEWKK